MVDLMWEFVLFTFQNFVWFIFVSSLLLLLLYLNFNLLKNKEKNLIKARHIKRRNDDWILDLIHLALSFSFTFGDICVALNAYAIFLLFCSTWERELDNWFWIFLREKYVVSIKKKNYLFWLNNIYIINYTMNLLFICVLSFF